jgi:HlyD family secretion protein
MALPDLGTSPFRQSAIDRLSSPEQLDQLVKVADAKGWVAALGIALIIAFGALWGAFGSIATEVQAPGILVLRGGHLMTIPSPASGMITEMRVRAGDVVKKGDIVAIVQQTELQQRLADARDVLKERENTLALRRIALDSEMTTRRQNADVRRTVLLQSNQATAQRLERLRRQLAIREQLRSQNLEVEDRVEETRGEVARGVQELSDSKTRILDIDASMQDAAASQQKELDSLQQIVAEARRNVAQLETRLQDSRAVEAPATGRVTEVTTSIGTTVDPGAPILNIETSGEGLQATVYIPIASGKRVHPGMMVHIEPSTVRREEFGMLVGTIVDVSSFPSTPAGMHAVLQNQRLVDAFSGGSPPYEARVSLVSAATPTGYAWTSGTGPHTDLTSGTTVKTYIAVAEDPPLLLLMPFLRPLFRQH